MERTLIERLEAGETGREIEGRTLLALFPSDYEQIDVPPDADGKNAGKAWAPKGLLKKGYQLPPKGAISDVMLVSPGHPLDQFTENTDAAIRLARRTGACSFQLSFFQSGSTATVYTYPKTFVARAPTPAAALVAALLRAMGGE